MLTSLQTEWMDSILPQMQQEMATFQNQIAQNLLTGWELQYAQYMVAATNFEIFSFVPPILAMPLF
jgi:hypothetical protein